MTPAPFRRAWWCPGAHLQTLWSSLARTRLRVKLRRERLELPDGDFLDLDWTDKSAGPIVVILHGLEGSSRSPYARGLLKILANSGYRGVVMHFRGCSGSSNRLPRSYHSGDTGDLTYVIDTLRAREPDAQLAVVGYSLGGNVLLKWLGETRSANPLCAAVAVSVPYQLAATAERINLGFSRLYQWKFLKSLRRKITIKQRHQDWSLQIRSVSLLKSLREFDNWVTAPLHGFADADDYYQQASCRRYIRSITVPTLLLHAIDDPLIPSTVIPKLGEISPSVNLEVYTTGGHVGFVSGRWPWSPRYWLEARIPQFLNSRLHSSVSTYEQG